MRNNLFFCYFVIFFYFYYFIIVYFMSIHFWLVEWINLLNKWDRNWIIRDNWVNQTHKQNMAFIGRFLSKKNYYSVLRIINIFVSFFSQHKQSLSKQLKRKIIFFFLHKRQKTIYYFIWLEFNSIQFTWQLN